MCSLLSGLIGSWHLHYLVNLFSKYLIFIEIGNITVSLGPRLSVELQPSCAINYKQSFGMILSTVSLSYTIYIHLFFLTKN